MQVALRARGPAPADWPRLIPCRPIPASPHQGDIDDPSHRPAASGRPHACRGVSCRPDQPARVPDARHRARARRRGGLRPDRRCPSRPRPERRDPPGRYAAHPAGDHRAQGSAPLGLVRDRQFRPALARIPRGIRTRRLVPRHARRTLGRQRRRHRIRLPPAPRHRLVERRCVHRRRCRAQFRALGRCRGRGQFHGHPDGRPRRSRDADAARGRGHGARRPDRSRRPAAARHHPRRLALRLPGGAGAPFLRGRRHHGRPDRHRPVPAGLLRGRHPRRRRAARRPVVGHGGLWRPLCRPGRVHRLRHRSGRLAVGHRGRRGRHALRERRRVHRHHGPARLREIRGGDRQHPGHPAQPEGGRERRDALCRCRRSPRARTRRRQRHPAGARLFGSRHPGREPPRLPDPSRIRQGRAAPLRPGRGAADARGGRHGRFRPPARFPRRRLPARHLRRRGSPAARRRHPGRATNPARLDLLERLAEIPVLRHRMERPAARRPGPRPRLPLGRAVERMRLCLRDVRQPSRRGGARSPMPMRAATSWPGSNG